MGRTLLFYAVTRGERTTYVCARERRLAHHVPNLLSLGDAADCVGRAQPGARPCLGLSVCRWSWSFTTHLPLKRLLRVFILPRTYLVPGTWYYYNLTIIAFAPFRIGLVCTEAALFHSRKTKTPTLFEFAFRSTFNKKLKKHVSGECSACSSCVENSTTRNERRLSKVWCNSKSEKGRLNQVLLNEWYRSRHVPARAGVITLLSTLWPLLHDILTMELCETFMLAREPADNAAHSQSCCTPLLWRAPSE